MTARGPGIARLMLAVNVLILIVPLLALLLLRVYETHLLQQTERRLISESVLIGEAWRSEVMRLSGVPLDHQPDITPGWAIVDDVFPIEPVLDLADPDQDVRRSSTPTATPRQAADRSGPAWAAGAAIKPLLDRAKRVNLSGARVLDAEGCVVASTGGEVGACLDHLPEVRAALSGRYAAVARPRHSDSPEPPLGGISRRGRLRVFTATPLFADGQVIGVVRMSRTSLGPVEALWRQRRTFALALLCSLALTLGVSVFFARVITRPVRSITAAAEAIAAGRPRAPLPSGVVPREIRRLSEALDEMTAQLQARAAYITDFVGNVSHELKTPLSSIRGATELLQSDWAAMTEAQRQRFLSNIDAATARMTRQVSRLLLLARIEHTRAEAEIVPVVGWLEAFVASRAPQVEIGLRLQDPPAEIHIAPDHLTSVVGNLVDNALHHGAPPVVITAASSPEGRLVISVSDEGPGISENNQGRVFDRFFTTARDAGGTGLGLAIVQAVAQSRGGAASFESGPAGTTFQITL